MGKLEKKLGRKWDRFRNNFWGLDRWLTPIHLFPSDEPETFQRTVRLEPRFGAHGDIEIIGEHNLTKPEKYYIPPSYMTTVPDALVWGRVSMTVIADKYLAIPAEDHALAGNPTSFSNFLRQEKDRVLIEPNRKLRQHRRISEAVLITNRFAANYFHFIIDCLQSLCLADDLLRRNDLPVLAGEMPRQCLELLKMIAPGREVISISRLQWCRIDRLHMPIIGSYAPDQVDHIPLAGYESHYLPSIRERILASAPQTKQRPLRIIYISRRRIGKKTYRDVANSEEIEALIRSKGGAVVSPEAMSASEQIDLFRNADVIIAPAGAALANLLFCKPGAVCIGLHMNTTVNPWYLSTYAATAGVRWISVVGPAVDGEEPDNPHARFTIPLELIKRAVSISGANPQPQRLSVKL